MSLQCRFCCDFDSKVWDSFAVPFPLFCRPFAVCLHVNRFLAKGEQFDLTNEQKARGPLKSNRKINGQIKPLKMEVACVLENLNFGI